jgi:hypothetical protein
MAAVHAALPESVQAGGKLVVADAEAAGRIMNEWTGGVGCNAALEVQYLFFMHLQYV